MTDKETILNLGYSYARQLPDGTWLAVQRMLFTAGLFVDLSETGYRTRFCYEREIDALAALMTWDGRGDPPGPWIKEKPSNRLNPAWLDQALFGAAEAQAEICHFSPDEINDDR